MGCLKEKIVNDEQNTIGNQMYDFFFSLSVVSIFSSIISKNWQPRLSHLLKPEYILGLRRITQKIFWGSSFNMTTLNQQVEFNGTWLKQKLMR